MKFLFLIIILAFLVWFTGYAFISVSSKNRFVLLLFRIVLIISSIGIAFTLLFFMYRSVFDRQWKYRNSNTIKDCIYYLDKWPKGRYSPVIRERIDSIVIHERERQKYPSLNRHLQMMCYCIDKDMPELANKCKQFAAEDYLQLYYASDTISSILWRDSIIAYLIELPHYRLLDLDTCSLRMASNRSQREKDSILRYSSTALTEYYKANNYEDDSLLFFKAEHHKYPHKLYDLGQPRYFYPSHTKREILSNYLDTISRRFGEGIEVAKARITMLRDSINYLKKELEETWEYANHLSDIIHEYGIVE